MTLLIRRNDDMLELTNADWSLGGRSTVRSLNGIVAAAHPLAANAGAEALASAYGFSAES